MKLDPDKSLYSVFVFALGHLYAVAENDYATRLHIDGLLIEDSGSYQCVTGTLSSRLDLQVTGKCFNKSQRSKVRTIFNLCL